MARRVTQADVAAHAGVSRALVSLVLRDASNVSDHRRKVVLDAMAELGYRPNAAARHLGRRTRTVGVMVQDLHYPFFAEVVDGIQSHAAEHGLQVLINTGLRQPDVEHAAIETFLELRMDGIVLISPQLPDDRLLEAAGVVPTVLVGRPLADDAVDTVVTDERRGGWLATRHLTELGHRRILHVTAAEANASSVGREAGYRQAMAEAGLAEWARIVRDGEDVAAAASSWPGEPPASALFGHNDFVAVNAWARLVEAGGKDPAVVGYDNTNFAGLPLLSLTSVDQPRLVMGRTAVEMLVERVDGRSRARHEVMAPTLVVRRSSHPPAG
jgi:DNA-binding LacI/PurR family transcriptional regulator